MSTHHYVSPIGVRYLVDEAGNAGLTEPDLLKYLEQAIHNGHAVLIHTNEAGSVHVSVSYGDLDKDQAAYQAFDEAEYGADRSLEAALRYALGAHYGSTDGWDELERVSP